MCLTALSLFGAAAALAESPVTVDCVQHGKLTHHYTVAQLQTAVQTMPAEIQEYDSACYELIVAQLNSQLGTKNLNHQTTTTVPSSGSSPFLSTPLLIIVVVIVITGVVFALRARRTGQDKPPSDDTSA